MKLCAQRTYRQVEMCAPCTYALQMSDRAANLLGAVSLAIADGIEDAARDVLSHAGETPAALVVIGYGTEPSNDALRRVLGLSHPGTVRLVDRLVADGLVERKRGDDRRKVALHLTPTGHKARERVLAGRLATIRPFLSVLDAQEQSDLERLLHKMLASLGTTDAQRTTLCRLCDDRVCTDCPIPADFRETKSRL